MLGVGGEGIGIYETVEKAPPDQRVKVQAAAPGKAKGCRSVLVPEVGSRISRPRPGLFLQ